MSAHTQPLTALDSFIQTTRRHFGLAGLCLTGLVAGCNQGLGTAAAPGGTPQALPVTVLEAQPQSIPYALEIIGQTEGAKQTEVRARVGGIIVQRLYQEGAPVSAGQPLFQIDRAPYEIALAEAQAKASQAEREKNRLQGLVEQNAISKKEFDDATTQHQLAQTALRQAQLNLSWTTVTAPVAGASGRALKSEGSLVTVGTDSLLTSVVLNNPMWVRFSLSETETAALPGGQLNSKTVTGVELILPDGTIYPNKGKLNFLASTIDPTLGTRQLRAEFDNKSGQLLAGQFVRVRVLAGLRENVFLVPQSAVLQTEQGRMLMTVGDESKVAPRPVQVGEWQGKDWIILGGLKTGDKVIVDNLMKLRPGAPVAPKAPTSAPAATPASLPTTPAAAK
jgi:membrane fusion protein, multidrug efflux system